MRIPSKVYPYRLPYMGSKQNIAYSLMLAILQKKPKAKYFFDIFGGGASMSLMAKQFDLKVFYAEKNEGIVNLLNFLKDNKIPKEWVRWINRDEFKGCLGKSDPFSVFVTIVWSFGNNRQAYLFGKDIEELNVYLLGEKISSDNIKILNELGERYSRKVVVINAPKFDITELDKREASIMYASDGSEFYRLGELRENVTYDDLPEVFIDALIATEDSRALEYVVLILPFAP